MKYLLLIATLTLAVVCFIALAQAKDKNDDIFTQNFHTLIPSYIPSVHNYLRLDASIATGGKLSFPDAAKDLQTAGFKSVIDIRQKREGTEKEEKYITNADMIYHNFPISGSTAFIDANVKIFAKLISESEKPLLVHSASGNRVGALWAQHLIDEGMDIDEAISIGLRMGMRNDFSSKVRQKYSEKSE
ncbi:MAG: hypothetical protein ACI9TY_000044 [Alphaproteobacteria bacterium]|jgi:uncharacterized protein (TIGR01244 family)